MYNCAHSLYTEYPYHIYLYVIDILFTYVMKALFSVGCLPRVITIYEGIVCLLASFNVVTFAQMF